MNLGFAHTAIHDQANNYIFFHGGISINNQLTTTTSQNHNSTKAPFKFKSVDDLRRNFKAYLFDTTKQIKEEPTSSPHIRFDPVPHMSASLYKYDIKLQIWTELPQGKHSSYMHSSIMYNENVITFGGITHSDGRSLVKVSDTLRIFNTRIGEWMAMELTFDHRQRYAHSAFVYRESLYVFAGFNGFFLNDLFKVDLGSLDLATKLRVRSKLSFETIS